MFSYSKYCNLCPFHWECRILTLGTPGKPLEYTFRFLLWPVIISECCLFISVWRLSYNLSTIDCYFNSTIIWRQILCTVNFFNLLRFYDPEYGVSWWMFHVYLEKKSVLCCCWTEYLKMSIRSTWMLVLLSFSTSLLILYFLYSEEHRSLQL